MWGWRWWAGPALALVALTLLLAFLFGLGAFALLERFPWLVAIPYTLLGVHLAGWTFRKMTSDPRVDDEWSSHLAYLAVASIPITRGVREALDPRINRL